MSKTVDGTDRPVFMKRDLQDGLPFLKKQNLHYTAYAQKTVQELFTSEQLKNAVVKKIDFMSSIVAIHSGNGKFTVQPLPETVQLSSVKTIATADINKDGFTDLIVGGNEFNFQPQLGRLDANTGLVLVNDGKGNFKVLSPEASGIDLKGMVRDIASISVKGEQHFLFLQNDELPVLFRIKAANAATK